MSDADARLERLERLTRLRDGGALSAEEFAVEKRRVLMGEEARPPVARPMPPPPAPAQQVYVEPAPQVQRPRRRLPIAALVTGVAALSAIGAYAFINTTPTDVPGRSAPKARPAPTPVAVPTAGTPPAAAASTAVDLTSTLRFSNAGQCIFGSSAARLFDTLMPQADTGGHARAPARVALAGLDLPVATRNDMVADAPPGSHDLTVSVRLPEGARWNALKMSRIVRKYRDIPESDDTDTRMITFLNPAADVQAALKNAGVSVPIAPKYRELDGTGGSCGGTMQVAPITGGAALICSWGC